MERIENTVEGFVVAATFEGKKTEYLVCPLDDGFDTFTFYAEEATIFYEKEYAQKAMEIQEMCKWDGEIKILRIKRSSVVELS